MVLAKFYVTLDKDNCVFFPGQEITGSVHVWNDKPKNVNGIIKSTRMLNIKPQTLLCIILSLM
jgi:hypothetical protein